MYQEIGGAVRFVKFAECLPGQVIAEGRYVKSSQGKFGLNHEFMEATGQCVVLNGCGSLNKRLEYALAGDEIKVVYNRMSVLTEGPYAGKNFHDISVFKKDAEKKVLAPQDLQAPTPETLNAQALTPEQLV